MFKTIWVWFSRVILRRKYEGESLSITFNGVDITGVVTGYSISSYRISLPCAYCCTDWDCAARPSCPKSDERYQMFINAGSDPRAAGRVDDA